MCRSIKTLRRPDDLATPEETRAAALQFVRKISGFHKPSKANQEAFERAVQEISDASARLLQTIRVSPRTAVSGDAELAETAAVPVLKG
ncbi:MAG TPA: DUF2277 domain-containing protein [Bryobacteraceae bacterium]|nr:DUF2277 domain-containing protein [Bryobacteraceae bacterium]